MASRPSALPSAILRVKMEHDERQRAIVGSCGRVGEYDDQRKERSGSPCKAALRTDADALQSLLTGLTGAFCDKVGSGVDSVNHSLFVLELWEFRSHDSQYDSLVLGERLEWLEATGTRGVVLKIEGVDVQFVEQLRGYDVVCPLSEVSRVYVIACRGRGRGTMGVSDCSSSLPFSETERAAHAR